MNIVFFALFLFNVGLQTSNKWNLDYNLIYIFNLNFINKNKYKTPFLISDYLFFFTRKTSTLVFHLLHFISIQYFIALNFSCFIFVLPPYPPVTRVVWKFSILIIIIIFFELYVQCILIVVAVGCLQVLRYKFFVIM